MGNKENAPLDAKSSELYLITHNFLRERKVDVPKMFAAAIGLAGDFCMTFDSKTLSGMY